MLQYLLITHICWGTCEHSTNAHQIYEALKMKQKLSSTTVDFKSRVVDESLSKTSTRCSVPENTSKLKNIEYFVTFATRFTDYTLVIFLDIQINKYTSVMYVCMCINIVLFTKIYNTDQRQMNVLFADAPELQAANILTFRAAVDDAKLIYVYGHF